MRISNFFASYCAADKEMQAFVAKVVLEKEKKLKEFNFKLLHGINPCNKNLFRWKVRPYDICDVCQEIQTIEHLLYKCSYVKPLWNVVDLAFETKVNFTQILLLDDLFDHSSVTALICFLIYKQWLLLSLENRKRNPVICLDYFKNETKLRIEICEKCTCVDPIHIQSLKKFTSVWRWSLNTSSITPSATTDISWWSKTITIQPQHPLAPPPLISEPQQIPASPPISEPQQTPASPPPISEPQQTSASPPPTSEPQQTPASPYGISEPQHLCPQRLLSDTDVNTHCTTTLRQALSSTSQLLVDKEFFCCDCTKGKNSVKPIGVSAQKQRSFATAGATVVLRRNKWEDTSVWSYVLLLGVLVSCFYIVCLSYINRVIIVSLMLK